MRHEAGLAVIPEQAKVEDLQTENIKKNCVGKYYEGAKPIFAPCKRQYHAFGRDWITNEIFRRVEPEGRTFGEYYR